jgi:hypothetical protein
MHVRAFLEGSGEGLVSDPFKRRLAQELLKLLAEEQKPRKGPPTKTDAKRRQYRRERLRELIAWLPTDERALIHPQSPFERT